MVKFSDKNAINANISYIIFKLNCKYYPRVFYKKDFDFCSKLKFIKELFFKFYNLITAYQQNLYYA